MFLLGRRILRRARRTLASRALKRAFQLRNPSITDEGLREALQAGADNLDSFLTQFRRRRGPRFYIGERRSEITALFHSHFPFSVERTIRDAEKICAHRFDFFGAETATSRSAVLQLGQDRYMPIDWHADFRTGYRWGQRIFYRDVRYKYPEGVDIKVPWEISRFQHLVTLGQAYWFTGEERYAREFTDQTQDWMTANPWPWGINWASAMEVSIRAVNWLIGFHFFKDSPAVDSTFLKAFLKGLLVHGRHIYANLENEDGLTTNHYLADLVGLVYLGVLLPEFKESSQWRDLAVSELLREMEVQVYPDGVSFEASTSYHRLALEIFFSAAHLCRLNNIILAESFWDRLASMFDFVLHYLKPNGRAPQIGDNDNGRLHCFKRRDPLDHSYLLTIAALLFRSGRYKDSHVQFDDEALWLFGPDAITEFDKLPYRDRPVSSKAFEYGQVFVLRRDETYVIVDCGQNGQHGLGGHAHNDKLSFELHVGGNDLVIDPGTYTYTAAPGVRELFRSARYHNVLTVDGEEIDRFNGLFRSRDDTPVRIHSWAVSPAGDTLDAEHRGFVRLKQPVRHRRMFHLRYDLACLVIRDILEGVGQHTFDWYFHLAAHLVFRPVDQDVRNVLYRRCRAIEQELGDALEVSGSFMGVIPGRAGLMFAMVPLCRASLSASMDEGWWSPSYGRRERTAVAHYSMRATCPFEATYVLLWIMPAEGS